MLNQKEENTANAEGWYTCIKAYKMLTWRGKKKKKQNQTHHVKPKQSSHISIVKFQCLCKIFSW